jgi:hypothetical protein
MLDVMVKMLGMVWLAGLPISVDNTIGSFLARIFHQNQKYPQIGFHYSSRMSLERSDAPF